MFKKLRLMAKAGYNYIEETEGVMRELAKV